VTRSKCCAREAMSARACACWTCLHVGHTFDLVTERLILHNVPRPEEIVAEAVRLARPEDGSRSTRAIGGAGVRPARRVVESLMDVTQRMQTAT